MKRTWKMFGFALLLATTAAFALTGCGGEEKTYQIIFDSNGGSEVAPIEVKSGEQMDGLPHPDKSGYKFDGWYWDNNTFELPFLPESIIDMEISENKTVYAKWRKTYTISFDSNGGSAVSSISTIGYELIELPVPPLKYGHIFRGWYWDNGTFSVPFNEQSLLITPIAQDCTVYAKWELGSGGETPDPDPDPAPETFELYALKKMIVTSPMGDVTIDLANITPEQNAQYGAVIDLYGRSVEIGGKQIKFTGSVLSLYNPVSYTLNGTTLVLSDETVAGTFNSITLDSGEFRFGVESTGGGFAFVYRSASYVSQERKVTFVYQGATSGNTIKSKIVTYGEPYGELPVPERVGYTFKGWFLTPDGDGNQVTSDTLYETDWDVLFAHWEGNKYYIFFDYKGGGPSYYEKSMEVTYGKNAKLPYPEKKGYTFEGWWAIDENGEEFKLNVEIEGPPYLIAGDTYAVARWSKKTITINFHYEGAQSGNTELKREVEYEANIGTLPVPTKEGNEFQGWFTVPGGREIKYEDNKNMYSEYDVDLYAKWQATITFEYAGASVGNNPLSMTVIYRRFVGALPTPTRTGYSFGGWFTEENGAGKRYLENMGFEADGSLTLYANWIPDTQAAALKIEQGKTADQTAIDAKRKV